MGKRQQRHLARTPCGNAPCTVKMSLVGVWMTMANLSGIHCPISTKQKMREILVVRVWETNAIEWIFVLHSQYSMRDARDMYQTSAWYIFLIICCPVWTMIYISYNIHYRLHVCTVGGLTISGTVCTRILYCTQKHKKASNHHANLLLEMYSFTL